MRRVEQICAAALVAFGLTCGVNDARATPAAPPPAAPDPATAPDRALAREIISRLGQVPERTRPFHETREIAALTRPLVTSGVLIFRRPAYLRQSTLVPHHEEMILDGNAVSIQRGTDSAHVVALDQSPALAVLATTLRAPLEGDIAALDRYYTLAATGDDRAWMLVMTPSDPDAMRFVRTVSLWGRNNAIDRLRVVLANGDVQTLTIDP